MDEILCQFRCSRCKRDLPYTEMRPRENWEVGDIVYDYSEMCSVCEGDWKREEEERWKNQKQSF